MTGLTFIPSEVDWSALEGGTKYHGEEPEDDESTNGPNGDLEDPVRKGTVKEHENRGFYRGVGKGVDVGEDE